MQAGFEKFIKERKYLTNVTRLQAIKPLSPPANAT